MKPNTEKITVPRSVLLASMAALVFFVGLFATAQIASADGPTCMDDAAGKKLVCTASDVKIAKYNVLNGVSECTVGDPVTLLLQAELLGTAQTRYDPGFYVALDGGDAHNGSCYQDYLPPPLSTDTVTPPGPRLSPFYDAEDGPDPDDTCGDLEQGVVNLRNLQEITIMCEDEDNNGYLDVGTCTSWENQASAGDENKPSCTGFEGTIAGTPAKCYCESVQVGQVVVLGKIVVDKVTVPSPDLTETSFPFTLTGGPDSINRLFSLTDAASPYDSNGLKAGTYSVTEDTPGGWDLTSAACSGDNGTPGDTSDDRSIDPALIDLKPGETVNCTFTNELQTGNIIVKKETTPDGSTQMFEFDPSWSDTNFPLSDGLQSDSGPLLVGTYSVAEVNIPPLWSLTSSSCTSSLGQLAEDPSSINLDAGETVICTFNDTFQKAQPTISTSAVTPVTVGADIHDTATMGGLVNPTGLGTITFKLYSDDACTTEVFSDVATSINANGDYDSGDYTTTVPGSYYWVASFSGDANNEAVATECKDAGETSVVNKAQPTISTSAVTPVTVGADIHDTATMGGLVNPTGLGTITFKLYSDDACTTEVFSDVATSINANGDYDSGDYTTTAAGSYYWVASFSGDANNKAVATECKDAGETSVVNKAQPSIVTYPDPTLAPVGATLNDSAVLSGGYNATGEITFKLYDPTDATCFGDPAFTQDVDVSGDDTYYTTGGYVSDMTGTWNWTAEYSGDPNNERATSGCGEEPVTVVPPSEVTDTSFCPLQNDQFRLIYTPDMQNLPYYKLTSSNPGQFYYNVFYFGTPGDPVTLDIEIPYPFLTQGAVPIQVHNDVTYDTSGCYIPGPRLLYGFQIETEKSPPVSPSGNEIIGFEDYDPDEIGSFTTVTVSGKVPSTGLLYVTIHLDYGLEGRDPDGDGDPNLYDKSGNGDAVDPDNPATVLIQNAWDYVFSVSGAMSDSWTVTNFNEFKKFWGFGGMVLIAGTEEPPEDARIIIEDPDGEEISLPPQTGVVLIGNELHIDEDGFYTLSWKHKGKEATYTVKLEPPTGYECVESCVVPVSLGKGVKFAEVNFDIIEPSP